jgi:hypothetical protein
MDGQAHPDFGGIWSSATATPLERPAKLKDKPFFTPPEAAEFERALAVQNENPVPQSTASEARTVGTYNRAFFEFGSHVVKTLRTSVITDPPDGRIPALRPAAAEVKAIARNCSEIPVGPRIWGCRTSALFSRQRCRR